MFSSNRENPFNNSSRRKKLLSPTVFSNPISSDKGKTPISMFFNNKKNPFNNSRRKLLAPTVYPLSTVICQSGLSYHFFAGDSQLHKSSVPSNFPVHACCLKDCIEDIAEWMGDSKLKMNDDKSDLMAIGTRSKLSQVIPNLCPMSISGCDIPFSQSVRNLGFCLDETYCSVSCAELEKSAPSCQLMMPANLLFLSFSLG